MTYLVSIILLGGSFGAVYGLSQAQLANATDRILSLVISIIISLINVILGRNFFIYIRGYSSINKTGKRFYLNKTSSKSRI